MKTVRGSWVGGFGWLAFNFLASESNDALVCVIRLKIACTESGLLMTESA